MKLFGTLMAILLVASCSAANSATEASSTTDDDAIGTTDLTDADDATDPANLNSGTHRYRYVESIENPDNGCNTSAEIGDELTQTITFEESRVVIVFRPDSLPEGSEPGLREYDEQLGPNLWREEQESSSGSGLYEHTVEFTTNGIVMTSILSGEPCFFSVRDRIDG